MAIRQIMPPRPPAPPSSNAAANTSTRSISDINREMSEIAKQLNGMYPGTSRDNLTAELNTLRQERTTAMRNRVPSTSSPSGPPAQQEVVSGQGPVEESPVSEEMGSAPMADTYNPNRSEEATDAMVAGQGDSGGVTQTSLKYLDPGSNPALNISNITSMSGDPDQSEGAHNLAYDVNGDGIITMSGDVIPYLRQSQGMLTPGYEDYFSNIYGPIEDTSGPSGPPAQQEVVSGQGPVQEAPVGEEMGSAPIADSYDPNRSEEATEKMVAGQIKESPGPFGAPESTDDIFDDTSDSGNSLADYYSSEDYNSGTSDAKYGGSPLYEAYGPRKDLSDLDPTDPRVALQTKYRQLNSANGRGDFAGAASIRDQIETMQTDVNASFEANPSDYPRMGGIGDAQIDDVPDDLPIEEPISDRPTNPFIDEDQYMEELDEVQEDNLNQGIGSEGAPDPVSDPVSDPIPDPAPDPTVPNFIREYEKPDFIPDPDPIPDPVADPVGDPVADPVDDIFDTAPDPIPEPDPYVPIYGRDFDADAPESTDESGGIMNGLAPATPVGEEGNPGITSFGNMSSVDLQRQLNRGNIAPENVADAQARINRLNNEQFVTRETSDRRDRSVPEVLPSGVPLNDDVPMDIQRDSPIPVLGEDWEEEYKKFADDFGWGETRPEVRPSTGTGIDFSKQQVGMGGPLPKGYYSGPADGVYKYGEGPYAEETQKFLDSNASIQDYVPGVPSARPKNPLFDVSDSLGELLEEGRNKRSDREQYIGQQTAPIFYETHEDYQTGRKAAGERYDANQNTIPTMEEDTTFWNEINPEDYGSAPISMLTNTDGLSGGIGGANPEGMGGAGQGGFQFPMQQDTTQTPYSQPDSYGMTMNRHGVQSPTYDQTMQMPQPQPGDYGTSPAYSGYDTSNSNVYTAPQLNTVYSAQPVYG